MNTNKLVIIIPTISAIIISLISCGTESKSIHEAARSGDIKGVRYFIDRGVNINTTAKHGTTPLHYAVTNNHIDIVKILIKNGADIKVKNKLGDTPLHIGVSFCNTKMIDLLLKHNAKVNIKSENGKTPLNQLTLCHCDNYKNIITMLIKHGANINSKDNSGSTLLHLASGYDTNSDYIKFLIGKSATVNSGDNLNNHYYLQCYFSAHSRRTLLIFSSIFRPIASHSSSFSSHSLSHSLIPFSIFPSTFLAISSHSLSFGPLNFLYIPALPPPPPLYIIQMPSMNPKSYHEPLLLTSYILTESVKRLMIKVTKDISPCQRPAQNPAGSYTNLDSGPGAHPRKKANTIKKTMTGRNILNNIFIGTPDMN
jgi:ankyrin repeat protein